jgi:hypothetical protein
MLKKNFIRMDPLSFFYTAKYIFQLQDAKLGAFALACHVV